MKNLFNNISESEKNRILEMHKSATNKHYLKEQSDESEFDLGNSPSDINTMFRDQIKSNASSDNQPDEPLSPPSNTFSFSATNQATGIKYVYEIEDLTPKMLGQFCTFMGSIRGYSQNEDIKFIFNCFKPNTIDVSHKDSHRRSSCTISPKASAKFKEACKCGDIASNTQSTSDIDTTDVA